MNSSNTGGPSDQHSDDQPSSGQHSPDRHWIAQHSRPVIFLILTFGLLGAYLAFTIPISVFPETNFPRVLIAVDNGVMPIDQMTVTVTRPIEEAVNSVPGLLTVRSITSRGSAEVDLYFRWGVDMFQTLQYVNAAISRVQPELPATAKIEAPPPDLRRVSGHRLQPDLRQHASNQAVGDGDV